jgi:Fe2+ or Zn2+ uptake regulation protein
MSIASAFLEFCRLNRVRVTEHRRAVVLQVERFTKPFGVDDLLLGIGAEGLGVSRASVLRTLRVLEDARLVRRADGQWIINSS